MTHPPLVYGLSQVVKIQGENNKAAQHAAGKELKKPKTNNLCT